MTRSQFGPGQLIAGAGGALLIVSLFLPWADAGGASRSGWELWTMADVFFLIAGLCAIAAAFTGGRFGLFRLPNLPVANGGTRCRLLPLAQRRRSSKRPQRPLLLAPA